MSIRRFSIVLTLAFAVLTNASPDVLARGGGGGGGGHGGGGGGAHFGGGGHFGGAGWGGRGFGPGFRGYGWGGYRGYGWGGYRGYGWGYPGYGYGLGLGVGLSYGLYGGYGYGGYGYGGYSYGGYGYGYPGYGNYGYDSYGTGYGPAYAPAAYENATPPAAAPMTAAKVEASTLQASREFADKGEAAFRTRDYAGAVYALRHAAVDDPNNAVVTLLLGQALFATGRFDEAAGATQAAMRQLSADRWGVVISHYTELYADTKDYTQQLRTLEKAVKEKPDAPALRFLAGFHYAYLGFTQQAIDQLERALKLSPRDELARQLRDELRGKLAKPSIPPVPPAPGIKSGPEIEVE
jgi:hypothetical protein